MKKIMKILLTVIAIVYVAIIVLVTGCLLFYNQYKVTQINDKTLIIIDDKSDKYKDGDLVIFTKNPNNEITSGDEIFFYEISHGKVTITKGEVTNAEKITDAETTFTINGNHEISSETVIGKTETASVYHNLGKFLYIFESKYGFLILVIFPALLFFFYEVYKLINEIKRPAKDEEEESQNEIEPAPVQPEPIQSAPAQPVEPAPVQPEPAQPEPAQPAPAQPNPQDTPKNDDEIETL